ncbi:MAG: hypothetical protein ACRYFS_13645 [Janthinobacterium lividum]
MADNKAPLMAFLTAEGYVPTADEQGGIAFKREGRVFLSFVADDDPNYFNLYCYMSYGDVVTSRDKALTVANEVNRSIKAIKITLLDDNDPSKISFGIESLMPGPDSFQPIFERSLAIISLSIDQFSSKVSSARPFRPETPAA